MTLPPSEFAETFRVHVVPLLRDQIAIHGVLAGLDLEDLLDAWDEVLAFALDRRAGMLPPEHLDALEDWIWDCLKAAVLVEEIATERRVAEFAHVTADVNRWNAEVLKAFGCAG